MRVVFTIIPALGRLHRKKVAPRGSRHRCIHPMQSRFYAKFLHAYSISSMLYILIT